MRHRRPAKEPVAACLLLFLVASLHGQVAAVAEGADCALGCPHILDLVCGADHNTYQSRCLAECQGVEVVAENACNDENFTTRNPRAIHLHRLLLNTPSNLNQQQRTDHDTLQQQPQQQQQQQQPRPQHKAAQDLGHAPKDEQPQARQRMLSQTDMQTFRKEGFKLLGLIHLQDQAEDEPGACSNERNEQDDKYGALGGSNSNSNHGPVSTTVRALRVTQKGLLYAAMYDLDALTQAIKNASIRSGLAPPPPQQPESSDQQQGNSEQGSSGDTQYAGLGPGGQDIIQQSNGMPCLSYFNPHKHQQHTKQQRKQLQETTINPPPTYGSGAVDGSASEYAPPADLQQVEITSPPPELPPPSPSTSPLPTFAPPPPLLPSLPTCPIKQFPYTAIGQLQLKNSKGALVCSGVLVGSDAVLTAAHCVFQRDNQGGGSFFSRLDFAAGRYRADNVTYNPYNVTAWAFATIFHTYQSVPDIYSFDWDVAIIRLSSPVGDEAGWLGMASGCAVSAATGQPATSYTVATAGYASAAPFGTCTASTCSIIRDDCQSSTAYHTCPSLSGQSGSPFFMQKDFRVRGILVGTIPAANGNPLKITHLVGTKSYSALLKWIAEPLPGAIDEETNGLTVVAGSAAAAASENEVAADALDTNSTTMAGQVANATLMINTMAGNVSSQVLMDAQSAPPHPGPLSPPNRNGTLPPPPPRKVAVSRNSTALRNRPPPPGPHSTPCNRTGSRRALSCRTRSRQRRQLATVYSQKQQPCQA